MSSNSSSTQGVNTGQFRGLSEVVRILRCRQRNSVVLSTLMEPSLPRLLLLFPEPHPMHMPRTRLGVADLPSDAMASHHFRFARADLARLVPLLRLPATITTPTNRYTATPEEAVLLVLFRLSYPSRWNDQIYRDLFNRSAPELCEIFNTTCSLLWRTWGDRATCWRDAFAPTNARYLAECSARKMGYAGALFVVYIDGSDIYIQRPGGANINQRSMYTGHHRQHAVLFLGGLTPNGIWALLFGPFPGTCNDACAYSLANVEMKLRHLLAPVNAGRRPGDCVCAAADSAFPLSPVLQTRRNGVALTPAEQAYNASFSSVRDCVEWGFAKVFSLFPHINWCVSRFFSTLTLFYLLPLP